MDRDPQDWIARREAKLAKRALNQAYHEKVWRDEKAAFQEQSDRKAAVRKAARLIRKAGPEGPIGGPGAPDPRLLSDDELVALAAALLEVDKYDWAANARPEQLPPDDYTVWLLLAGRGFGKTRCAAEAVREVCKEPGKRAAVIAKDHRALRDVCFDGVSGLLACIPPAEVKSYHKGLGDVSIELMNGSTIRGYTAGEPDAVRGQSFDIIWGDEFAAWPKNRAQDMLDQAMMCLREAKEGARAILSTTPKRVPHVVSMIELAKDPAEKIVITRGTSRDNPVLNEEWHRQMERKYGGTRLGRQELLGELVMDNELALWTGHMIEAARWDPDDDSDYPRLAGVIVGVDPSGSNDGDATGVAAVGWDKDKTIYVIENRTCNGTPAERYTEACMSAYRNNAIEIWYESAYGGDNCKFGIEQQWKNLQEIGSIPKEKRCPPVKPSTIKGDKAARAMPVVTLYEQQMNLPDRRRIWHPQPTAINGIAALEDMMLTWETDSKRSPNDIDALVHATRQIMRRLGLEVGVSTAAKSKRKASGGYNPTAGKSRFNPLGRR